MTLLAGGAAARRPAAEARMTPLVGLLRAPGAVDDGGRSAGFGGCGDVGVRPRETTATDREWIPMPLTGDDALRLSYDQLLSHYAPTMSVQVRVSVGRH